MNTVYRTIDANLNRCAEGVRVLEDYARFDLVDMELTNLLRHLRHNIRKDIKVLPYTLIYYRNSEKDIGKNISKMSNLDHKTNSDELIEGNFKRIQEAIRTIEENLKVIGENELSKKYEELRFTAYNIEKCYMEKYKKHAKILFFNTDLYCITAEKYSNGKSNAEVVKELIESGIKIIQYREKEKSKIEKLHECEVIRKITKDNDVLFIVNDDLDIALLTNADGLHIGQNDIPVVKARQLVGRKMILGVSTHSPSQAFDAVASGADYIGVGPVFRTNTKENVCAPVGLEYVEFAVQNIQSPFVVIGGIKLDNIASVSKKGASLFCLVTEIVGASDIARTICKIRNKIKEI